MATLKPWSPHQRMDMCCIASALVCREMQCSRGLRASEAFLQESRSFPVEDLKPVPFAKDHQRDQGGPELWCWAMGGTATAWLGFQDFEI